MGRRGLLHVEIHGNEDTDGIYVGGHVTPLVEAVMTSAPITSQAGTENAGVKTAPKRHFEATRQKPSAKYHKLVKASGN